MPRFVPGLFDHFELSFDTARPSASASGRILRRDSDEARADMEAQKEFELLGAQVAVPILDRETLVGVAISTDGSPASLDQRRAGIDFPSARAGRAGRPQHLVARPIAGNHEMMAGMLRELSSACVVVSRDLKILHANKGAASISARPVRTGEMEFSDLPGSAQQGLSGLENRRRLSPFKYEPDAEPGRCSTFRCAFQRQEAARPPRVAHDGGPDAERAIAAVGNRDGQPPPREDHGRADGARNRQRPGADFHAPAVAGGEISDTEFRASLPTRWPKASNASRGSINQMRFLARDRWSPEAVPLTPLIEEAYQEARNTSPCKTGALRYDNGGKPVIVTGDRAALKHAFTEVMINALQANPADPRLVAPRRTPMAGPACQIEVQDNGSGFTSEAMQKAVTPFYTTRNVGLGLGLAVTRKIIETHHGKLEIVPAAASPS